MVKTRKNPFLIPFKHTNPMPGEDFFGINLQDDEGIFRPISDKKRIEASKKNGFPAFRVDRLFPHLISAPAFQVDGKSLLSIV